MSYQTSFSDSDSRALDASVQTPSGQNAICLVKARSDYFGILHTSPENGVHLVSAMKGGKNITNSPFRVNVRGVSLNEDATRDLSLPIEGPIKAEISNADIEDDIFSIVPLIDVGSKCELTFTSFYSYSMRPSIPHLATLTKLKFTKFRRICMQ